VFEVIFLAIASNAFSIPAFTRSVTTTFIIAPSVVEFNDSTPGEAAGNDGGCVRRSGIAQPYSLHFASLRRGCCNTFAAKWN
jgi:hypothetical protein